MTKHVFINYSLRSLCLVNTTNRIKSKTKNPLLHVHIKWEHTGTYSHHIISYLIFFQIINLVFMWKDVCGYYSYICTLILVCFMTCSFCDDIQKKLLLYLWFQVITVLKYLILGSSLYYDDIKLIEHIISGCLKFIQLIIMTGRTMI